MSIVTSSVAPVEPGTQVEFERTWTADEALLYAVAVGAGRTPHRDLRFVTENSDGVAQEVLPAFAVLINQVQLPTRLGFSGAKGSVMYLDQQVTPLAPLPAHGRARVTAWVDEVLDKGSGAIVRVSTQSADIKTGTVLACTSTAYYLRGRGGFGGERGASVSQSPPHRPADRVLVVETRPEQALVYRLTGDRNPLHSDPAVADRAGFGRPILHGMCTYGIAALEIGAAFGAGNLMAAMTARFSGPVLPGDVLYIHCWEEADAVIFRVDTSTRVVLDGGRFDINLAPQAL